MKPPKLVIFSPKYKWFRVRILHTVRTYHSLHKDFSSDFFIKLKIIVLTIQSYLRVMPLVKPIIDFAQMCSCECSVLVLGDHGGGMDSWSSFFFLSKYKVHLKFQKNLKTTTVVVFRTCKISTQSISYFAKMAQFDS